MLWQVLILYRKMPISTCDYSENTGILSRIMPEIVLYYYPLNTCNDVYFEGPRGYIDMCQAIPCWINYRVERIVTCP